MVAQEIIALLNEPAFALWGADVSWAEIVGDVAGGFCVWLLSKQNIWNWPIGLINNVLWAATFWSTKLYAAAMLQGCFFALGAYGWWTWTRGGQSAHGSLRVRTTTRTEWIWLAGATVVGTVAIASVLGGSTDSPAPIADASILTLSLAATYGQTQKLLESWWLWVAVDAISVPLYASRQLYPTAILYLVFACLCVQGMRTWHRSLTSRETVP